MPVQIINTSTMREDIVSVMTNITGNMTIVKKIFAKDMKKLKILITKELVLDLYTVTLSKINGTVEIKNIPPVILKERNVLNGKKLLVI